MLVTAACATPVASTTPDVSPSYAGTWAVTVQDTPLGTVTGDLVIVEKEDGTLGGTYTSQEETLDLTTVKVKEDGVGVYFYLPSYSTNVDVELKGTPSATNLTGVTLGEYITSATRK